MLRLFVVSLCLILALGEAYDAWIRVFNAPEWQSLLAFNLLLALVILAFSRRVRDFLKVNALSFLVSLAPGALILIGAYLLTVIDSSPRGASSAIDTSFALLSCSLVPLCEEVIFRGFFSRFLSSDDHPFWALYFSGLVFSLAHSIPTFEKIMSFDIGFSLGPMILGMICAWLLRRFNNLYAPIAFHAACNGTVFIFTVHGPNWFNRLSALYM